jgi:hypothetical protein
MLLTIDSIVYTILGSIGILVVVEVTWWLGVIAFYKLAKIRQEALEEE